MVGKQEDLRNSILDYCSTLTELLDRMKNDYGVDMYPEIIEELQEQRDKFV